MDAFFDSLAEPGALMDDDDLGKQAPLCFCLGLKDRDGKVFDVYEDVAGWHGAVIVSARWGTIRRGVGSRSFRIMGMGVEGEGEGRRWVGMGRRRG